jgi:serine/threonine-protein kinase
MFCRHCGQNIEEDSYFCIGCGGKIASPEKLKKLSDKELEEILSDQQKETFKKSLQYIKYAYIFGFIYSALMVVLILFGVEGFDSWGYIDVILVALLAFGIYKKSRFCAVAILIYFVGGIILKLAIFGYSGGWLLWLIAVLAFWAGITGTFNYKKIRDSLIKN